MTLRVVFDTNIIIDHLRGIPQATQQLREIENGNFEGLMSTITVMELMAAPRMSEERFNIVKGIFEMFDLVPVESTIAAAAGSFLSKYRASHGLNPMDAIIAATAYVSESVLFTLNQKHFRFIQGLVSINPYLAEE